jgi:hypothetical protein
MMSCCAVVVVVEDAVCSVFAMEESGWCGDERVEEKELERVSEDPASLVPAAQLNNTREMVRRDEKGDLTMAQQM